MYLYQGYTQDHTIHKSINYDDTLAFAMLTRDEDFGIEQIKMTPAWFRYQILSLYTEEIHHTFSRLKPTFEKRAEEWLKMKFVDLNEDNIPEVMINYTGVDNCGNKDCPTEIYEISIETKSLHEIGSVTPWAYKILGTAYLVRHYNGYRLIVNCKYAGGGIELLVYSEIAKKYVSKYVPEKRHYSESGCKFFDEERLVVSTEIINDIVIMSNDWIKAWKK